MKVALSKIRLATQRARWRRRATSPILLAQLTAAMPDIKRDFRESPFLSVDLETTGLDPEKAEIVSIGFVPIDDARVRLAESVHLAVRPVDAMNQSAIVHGLTDSDLEDGVTVQAALESLLGALSGRILLLHCAALDRTLLFRECRRLFGAPFCAPLVDTLELERRRLVRRGVHIGSQQLRLSTLRQQYGLPRATLHDALSDAVATAELFLAMAHARATNGRLPVSELLC